MTNVSRTFKHQLLLTQVFTHRSTPKAFLNMLKHHYIYPLILFKICADTTISLGQLKIRQNPQAFKK